MPAPRLGPENPEQQHRKEIVAQAPGPCLLQDLALGDLPNRSGPRLDILYLLRREPKSAGNADRIGNRARIDDGDHAQVVNHPKRHAETHLGQRITPVSGTQRDHRIGRCGRR